MEEDGSMNLQYFSKSTEVFHSPFCFKSSSPEMFLCSLHRVCHILGFFLGTGYYIHVISFPLLQCYPLLQLDPGMTSRRKDIP